MSEDKYALSIGDSVVRSYQFGGTVMVKIVGQTPTRFKLENGVSILKKTPNGSFSTHGGQCGHSYYYFLSEEWKARIARDQLRKDFKQKMAELEYCNDVEVMKKVVAIELPKKSN